MSLKASGTGVCGWIVAGIFIGHLLSGAPAARAATPAQVDAAIKKGVAYLYAIQNDQGHWETIASISPDWKKEPAKPEGGQFGGLTSMSIYALMDTGETWRDPRLRKAIEWAYKTSMFGTYAVSFRSQIWQYLPQTPGVRAAAQRDCNLLLAGMKAHGDSRGFWSYFVNEGNVPRYDHSCSQIALLGIWGCSQAGREVPTAFWKEAELAWQRHQLEDGSWSYVFGAEGQPGTGKMTMTLAGVATLFITQDYVHASDGLACKGNMSDPRIQAGVKWIDEHWDSGVGGNYGLYAFERVAMASGYKYFGSHDWYKIGSQALVASQKPDGSWGTVQDTAFSLLFLSRGRQPVIVNKFEYEFEGAGVITVKPPTPRVVPPAPPPTVRPTPNAVVKPPVKPIKQPDAITPPVALKPLDPPVVDPANPRHAANWCERPRDVAIFTRWMASALERKLNWQIVNNKSPVDDYQDAPVLYMAGNQALDKLPKDTVDKLRQYIEEGGLIFGHPDCGAKEFTDSFIALGKKLFPMYEFRELPADHPIYTLQQFRRTKWKNPPSVMALSNGSRELMIISPNNDMAKFWQQNAYAGHEDAFQLMNGIVLYAADRQNLKFKGATHLVRKDDAGGVLPRQYKVARLTWNGNWDPEPGGWRRLTAILHNQKDGDITPEPIVLGEGKLDVAAYPIAHLTGTGQIALTKEQLADLRRFVIKGGVVLCDAAGGNSEFAEGAQRDLLQIIAGSKIEDVPADDPILGGKGGEVGPMFAPVYIKPGIFDSAATQPAATTTAPTTAPTTSPTTEPVMPAFRGGLLPPAEPAPEPAAAPVPPASKLTLPGGFPVEYRKFARSRLGDNLNLRLKGIKFRGKWAVIFSAEDLSTGMVGEQVDGVNGYTPATATEIMRRLVTNAGPKVDAPAAAANP